MNNPQFSRRFSNGIDPAKGVLTGIVVAEIGPALGHFAYLDRGGAVIGVGGAGDAAQFPLAARRVQLSMDERSLQTVVEAGQNAGRTKCRENHDDSIGARAGYVSNFRLDGGKAVCDLSVFDAYRNRGTFFETAQKTPDLVGLSGDFGFTAEVIGEKALMRVTQVDAVDIVDEGALTPAGLH